MRILEYGDPSNNKIILIHGFESPYQIWQDYIDFYKKDYCLIVPILTGHNVDDKEDFISFDKCVKELENYYITKYGNKVYAIYGMSMGGIVASYIWQNQNIEITKLILESSPLLPFGKVLINILTKQYLSITHKVKIRDEKTINQAINTIITIDKLNIFLQLMDHISNTTIINYIKEVGKFKLRNDIDTPNTKVYYLYGSTINEILFKKVAKYLKKHYPNTNTILLKNKGHCEDALINPQNHIITINKILKD